MKTFYKALILALFAISCESESGYIIEGTTTNMEDGAQVFLLELNENYQFEPIDTATVAQGAFSFKNPEVGQSEISRLAFKNKVGGITFVSENEKISIKVNGDSIAESKVMGGDQNDYFTTYFDELKNTQKELQTLQGEAQQAWNNQDTTQVKGIQDAMQNINKSSARKRLKMIKNHPDSPISVIILGDLLNGGFVEGKEAEDAFDSLNPDLQQTKRGQKISEYIAKLKEKEIAAARAEVGNKAPSFSGPTPDGDELALEDTLGKLTIIDFWASWCRPCRQENPNVVAVYQDYHDKGLNIISVSLDRPDNKEQWVKAIEQDNMNWFHISNLKFWDDPIAKKYGIGAIPATFLLDENGVIIDKNLRGPALRKKIEELLGNKAS